MALIEDAVKQAVEITKAGMPVQTGSLIHSPDVVAKFIEVVATKIHELRMMPSAPPRGH